MQAIAVYIIIMCAVVYAVRCVYLVIRGRHNPCEGCSGCDMRNRIIAQRGVKNGKMRGKMPCNDKKITE